MTALKGYNFWFYITICVKQNCFFTYLLIFSLHFLWKTDNLHLNYTLLCSFCAAKIISKKDTVEPQHISQKPTDSLLNDSVFWISEQTYALLRLQILRCMFLENKPFLSLVEDLDVDICSCTVYVINKTLFTSQISALFSKINPNLTPSFYNLFAQEFVNILQGSLFVWICTMWK